MISWCQKEAKHQKLKPEEYWGGLILDEMKIQVYTQIMLRKFTESSLYSLEFGQLERFGNLHQLYAVLLYFLCVRSCQEDLQLTINGGKHQLTGMVTLGEFYSDMEKIQSRKFSK